MKNKNIIYYIATIILFSLFLIPDVFAWCPLGEDVTKDLYGALKIFQILAPLFCIAFSTFDVVKTVSRGDADAEMKKVATKFGKRVIYTLLLFFLPIIVDQVMQIADVWGVNGTCNLTASESNDTDASSESSSNSNSTNKTTTTTRTSVNMEQYCLTLDSNVCSAANIFCQWDSSTNKCVPKNQTTTTTTTSLLTLPTTTSVSQFCSEFDDLTCSLNLKCQWNSNVNKCLPRS